MYITHDKHITGLDQLGSKSCKVHLIQTMRDRGVKRHNPLRKGCNDSKQWKFDQLIGNWSLAFHHHRKNVHDVFSLLGRDKMRIDDLKSLGKLKAA